jgi:hypothetical protein
VPEYRDPTLRRIWQASQDNAADVNAGLNLTDVLFDLVDSLLSAVDALNLRADAAEIREQTAQADIDVLQQRVAAIHPP